MTSVELREQRAARVKEARAILDKAKAEARELSAEEEQEYDRLIDEVDRAKVKIDRMEKIEAAESDMEAPAERVGAPINSESRERRRGEESGDRADAEERSAFVHFLRTGEVRPNIRRLARASSEQRDTIIGTDAKGGYLIAPVKVTADLVKAIDNQVFIRRLATVTRVTEAKKLGIRKLLTRMADSNWTTEVGAVTEDTTMAFDRRDLEPFLLTKLCKLSLRTAQLASDAEQIIRDELAYAFGVTEEKAFLTGDGSSKPLGVFTASASGISTGRDVATDNTATAITADGLISAKYSLKAGYMTDPSTAWIFHRDAIKMARKLKDSNGVYLWSPGLSSGEPDRILDTPFYMSEYAPNTFTTGLYVGIIGAFRWYRIAEVADFVVQRLLELYAATNEIGLLGRRWVDGAPLLEEAFARVKLA